jgi:hypothetical protein
VAKNIDSHSLRIIAPTASDSAVAFTPIRLSALHKKKSYRAWKKLATSLRSRVHGIFGKLARSILP